MLFYKYQKSSNVDFSMLRQGEVYFASAGELNDASECRPRFIFKGSEELWQRLAQYILEHACFGSDYFLNLDDKKNEIRQILDLSIVVGRQLKKQAGHKDFGIESLVPAFRNALKSCATEALSPFLLRTMEHLTMQLYSRRIATNPLGREIHCIVCVKRNKPHNVGALCRCGTRIREGVRSRRRQGQSSLKHKYPSRHEVIKNRWHRCY